MQLSFRFTSAAVFLVCFPLAHAQQASVQQPAPSAAQQTAQAKTSDSLLLAQQLDEAGSTTGAASTNGEGPEGIVPLTPGLNATLITTSQHDSAQGWSNIFTPDVAYRFSRHISVNTNIPVYTYINVSVSTVKKGPKGATLGTDYSLETRHWLLGDLLVAGEYEAHPHFFDYNGTVTLGTPTGDNANGLGAGQFTYNINNHFEHVLNNYLTPELELGIGDSPNLTNDRVHESYVAVGTNAHFQLGLGVSLPFNMTFTSDAFEDLPLAPQTVTSTTSNGKKGKQLRTVTTTSLESIGEDNGFLNTLDIPINGHITLSGFYNRSLRNKIDTAGFSLTFTLRSTPHVEPH